MVRVRVDPSVTSIPAKAFEGRKKFTKVELHEGLIEIGDHSFAKCDHSITKINIPNSIKRINDLAFYDSLRTTIRLHDDIESIGLETFSCFIFTNFRVPPLISAILDHMLYNCQSIFSVEIPEDVNEIGYNAFRYCYCLQNMAFPPDAVFGDEIFISEDDDELEMHTDLRLLFGSELQIMICSIAPMDYQSIN